MCSNCGMSFVDSISRNNIYINEFVSVLHLFDLCRGVHSKMHISCHCVFDEDVVVGLVEVDDFDGLHGLLEDDLSLSGNDGLRLHSHGLLSADTHVADGNNWLAHCHRLVPSNQTCRDVGGGSGTDILGLVSLHSHCLFHSLRPIQQRCCLLSGSGGDFGSDVSSLVEVLARFDLHGLHDLNMLSFRVDSRFLHRNNSGCLCGLLANNLSRRSFEYNFRLFSSYILSGIFGDWLNNDYGVNLNACLFERGGNDCCGSSSSSGQVLWRRGRGCLLFCLNDYILNLLFNIGGGRPGGIVSSHNNWFLLNGYGLKCHISSQCCDISF
mmetsp:Transcript_44083/g.32072  ORF Transcript_44083/g.32072 Transcript_44083/m.32072 type:complete len:324 (-) Transcript_44083:1256-2227(-)